MTTIAAPRLNITGNPTEQFCILAGRYLLTPERLLTVLADDLCADPPDVLILAAPGEDGSQLVLRLEVLPPALPL